MIEAGNLCRKNCLYCGIRKDSSQITRYRLSEDEIVRSAERARALGCKSLVIQSGELVSEAHTAFIERVLLRLRPISLGITLSLGEQPDDTYARWFAAGATRYLLRIETSNRELYAKIHPASSSWDHRLACLKSLRRLGYQVGTGVMCALPGQTPTDLARDILFFRDLDVDMIGMGPYIPAADTPLATPSERTRLTAAERLALALKMIALTRLVLKDVNIAAASALQALAPDGRARAIAAGANVVMPNVTNEAAKAAYLLYPGKSTCELTPEDDLAEMGRQFAALGEHLLFDELGDSRHFAARTQAIVPPQRIVPSVS